MHVGCHRSIQVYENQRVGNTQEMQNPGVSNLVTISYGVSRKHCTSPVVITKTLLLANMRFISNLRIAIIYDLVLCHSLTEMIKNFMFFHHLVFTLIISLLML